MWKKEEVPPPARPEAFVRPEPSASARAPAEKATIGRSITIRGDVTGDEDLLIQGRVDGSVSLKEHAVTVGSEGEVKASIVGRVVVIEGRVEGDVNSDDQVILRGSAWLKGDITAPRVVLEDGARFQGGIDMGDIGDHGRAAAGKRRGEARPGEAQISASAAGKATAVNGRSDTESGPDAARSGADATADSRT